MTEGRGSEERRKLGKECNEANEGGKGIDQEGMDFLYKREEKKRRTSELGAAVKLIE